MTFLSLNRGNATLLQAPGNVNALIGAGGPGDAPEIVRFLKQRGVTNLRLLMLGTWSERYVGGSLPLLKQFPIKMVVENANYVHTRDGDAAHQWAVDREQAKKLELHRSYPGFVDAVAYRPVCQMRLAGPTGAMSAQFKGDPDCSIMLELSVANLSIFDLGQTTRRLQRAFWSQIEDKPQGQVLVVGHDGAAGTLDTTMLRPLRTRYAILPIPRRGGKNPAKETLAALGEAGVKVFRTDRQGAITVTTDGREVEVKAER